MFVDLDVGNQLEFYAFLLGLGVYVSMRRQQSRRGTVAGEGHIMLGRLRRIAGVWLFFGLIHIWNIAPAPIEIGQRSRFFLSLLGVG